MNEVVNKILQGAVYAPSGDNSQPWKFYCNGLNIELVNLPDKDNPIFNYKQRGSYVAHGALLENIKLLSIVYGYKAEIELFPKKDNPDLVASITLSPLNKTNVDTSIRDLIKKRCTNRKKYQTTPLSKSQKNTLLENISEGGSGKILLIENAEKKQKLCNAASAAELIMLTYRPLHDAFFSMIRWNKNEESKKSGLFIDTLELAPPQKLIFKWFSSWKGSTMLRFFGLPTFIAKENAKIYSCCSAIIAIIMPDREPKNFVVTGMLMQKVWLSATKIDLSVQPIAGVLYLGQRLKDDAIEALPKNLRLLIENSVGEINKNFGNDSGTISMMLRIGKATEPNSRSIKFNPLILERT